MSSKKTPAKSASAKPAAKAKAKPVVKAKPATKPAPKAAAKTKAKPAAKVVAKPVAKSVAKPTPKPSGFKAAASKLTSALLGRKNEPAQKPAQKPAAKPAAAPKAAAPQKSGKATAVPAAPIRPLMKQPPRKINLDSQKGQMTESQIRKMSDKDYMNDAQLSFFHLRLLQMRQEVLGREVEVKERLHEREVFADPADRATAEEEHWLDLRLRERESYLLRKIDEAMRRIESNEFGYCEKTGDPIGIPRLLARPTATVCVDVKGQDERVEAQFRDR